MVGPTLLAQLNLPGVVVTGDAMQTQRRLRTPIVEAGGDYLWIVKANQPSLHADIAQVFAPQVLAPGCGPVPTDFTTARTVEQQHGRLEERLITVRSLLNDYVAWPAVAQVFKLERTVTDGLGQTTQDVRGGSTSLPAGVAPAARVLAIARAAWGIENGLHDRRDVSLQEDASQLRRGHGPQVLASLNNAVVSLAGQHACPNLAKLQRTLQYHFDRAIATDDRRTLEAPDFAPAVPLFCAPLTAVPAGCYNRNESFATHRSYLAACTIEIASHRVSVDPSASSARLKFH